VILTRTNVITTLTNVISTRTRVISIRRVGFWHVWVWLRHAQVWLVHARVEFQHDACDFNTNQLKLTYDYKKNPDWVLNSGYITRTSVTFTSCVWYWHPACDFGTLSLILALCLWFHACHLNTHACDFDTLRVKLLYYNIYISHSCTHMPDFRFLCKTT
jgi:hypothetical protein